MTTEAVLWEWLNAPADTTKRTIAAEGYRRAHVDSRVEVVPFGPELNGAAAESGNTVTRPAEKFSG